MGSLWQSQGGRNYERRAELWVNAEGKSSGVSVFRSETEGGGKAQKHWDVGQSSCGGTKTDKQPEVKAHKVCPWHLCLS
jgi:hypothetical protein